MPRGGPRPNSGRPTREQAALKAKLLLETLEKGKKVEPRAYLQALLASPGSSKAERLRAAELLLKAGPDPAPASSDSPPVEFKILCCPRGSHVHSDGKVYMYPEGELEFVEGLFEPFEGTAALAPTARRVREPKPEPKAIEPEPAPFETVEATPPANVTPLRPYERGVSFGARHDPSRTPSAADPFKYKPHGD